MTGSARRLPPPRGLRMPFIFHPLHRRPRPAPGGQLRRPPLLRGGRLLWAPRHRHRGALRLRRSLRCGGRGADSFPGNQLPFDCDADGEAGLEGYLRQTEYARLLWWPQPGVDKWVLWSGQRAPIDAEPLRVLKAFPPTPGSPLIPAGRRRKGRGHRPSPLAARRSPQDGAGACLRPHRPAPAALPRFRRWWAIPMDDGMDVVAPADPLHRDSAALERHRGSIASLEVTLSRPWRSGRGDLRAGDLWRAEQPVLG